MLVLCHQQVYSVMFPSSCWKKLADVSISWIFRSLRFSGLVLHHTNKDIVGSNMECASQISICVHEGYFKIGVFDIFLKVQWIHNWENILLKNDEWIHFEHSISKPKKMKRVSCEIRRRMHRHCSHLQWVIQARQKYNCKVKNIASFSKSEVWLKVPNWFHFLNFTIRTQHRARWNCSKRSIEIKSEKASCKIIRIKARRWNS